MHALTAVAHLGLTASTLPMILVAGEFCCCFAASWPAAPKTVTKSARLAVLHSGASPVLLNSHFPSLTAGFLF